MSDKEKYPVAGNVDFRTDQAFVDVLKYNDTVAAIFGSPEKVNIRRMKDKKTDKAKLPALAVDSVVTQSIPRTNEYNGKMQIFCMTQADNDEDAQKVQALAGAIRDAFHEDSTPEYEGHFKGDCNGFLEKVNKTQRGIVFHQIHEMETTPDDRGRMRILIVNCEVWMYPGAVDE